MNQKLPYPSDNAPMYPQLQDQEFNATAPENVPQDPPPPYSSLSQNQNIPELNQQEQSHEEQLIHAIVAAALTVGPYRTTMTCPFCSKEITSNIVHNSSTKTHLFAGILFLIGCWPCCLIPYCMKSCKNLNHYCPECKKFLGRF